MKKCNTVMSSDMHIRPLEGSDDLAQIFELCKKNDMTTENYATNIEIWNFQYNKNPIKKSWNSIVTENENILGHIGLYPLPLRGAKKKFLAGSISNGVLSKSIRNKLLPFKGKKTFSIIPLIDNCASTAFQEGADIVFAHSTIHSMIWKTLKYRKMDVTCKTTYHSGVKGLFLAYYSSLCKKRKIFSGSLGVIYSAMLTSKSILPILINRGVHFLTRNIKSDISIASFETFGVEFENLFNEFFDGNQDLVTYDRSIKYLNWKFSQSQFKKIMVTSHGKIIGYLVLQKIDGSDNFKVIDYVILNEFIKKSAFIFNFLSYIEGINISFTHFLSCGYSNLIYEALNKQGVELNLRPLSKLLKNQKETKAPIYYKSNDVGSNPVPSLDQYLWFISPIFFTPSYFK